MKNILTTLLLFFLTLSIAHSKVHQIDMRNSKDRQNMVFSPDYLQIDIGDEVEFIPVDKGHNSQAVLVPDGSTKWIGKNDENIKVNFLQEGIYIFECRNHAVMGMVGAVKVGKSLENLSETKIFLKKYQKKLVMNKVRIDKLIEKISK
jgi:pseudoazurin